MKTFLALLRRDLHVALRNAPVLVAGVLTQPVLVVLVFGNILPRLGLVANEFRTVMVPGLMAITVMMAGVQGILIPLAADLGGSREIEERLLSPLSVTSVALEKVAAGAIHASAAGLVALPLMIVLMHQVSGVDVRPRWPLLLPLVVLAGVLSASFGLNLGTRIQVRFAGLLFSLLLGPMMLFGCAYYPWASLTAIGAFQYLFLANPLVFISEAMRLAVTPEIPHMPAWLIGAGLLGYTLLFLLAGAKAFERRTLL